MKITGIIAEYNPFHLGHKYQLQQAKKTCDAVIVVMSGNFVQRGEPAIMDKWFRAQLALQHGADMVLELPIGYVLQPAEWFAHGAVHLLNSLGIVDTLCFGAETPDLAVLNTLAHLKMQEPAPVTQCMRAKLKTGYSYITARHYAIQQYLLHTCTVTEAEEILSALEQPNNILAVEYLCALQRMSSPMTPEPILRIGNYHSTDMDVPLPSASAIRYQLLHAIDLPDIYQHLYQDHLSPYVNWSCYEKILLYTLRCGQEFVLPDAEPGFLQRMHHAADQATTFESWLAQVKTKRYSTARIQRAACHALLHMTQADISMIRNEQPMYARILAVKKERRELLSLLNNSCNYSVVTQPSTFHPADAAVRRLWELDKQASDIYALAFGDIRGNSGRDLVERLILL